MRCYAFVLLLLSACGSSGSSDNPAPQPTATPTVPTTPTEPGSTPTTPTPIPTTAVAAGGSSVETAAPTPATGCPAMDPAAVNAPGTVHRANIDGTETLDLAGSPHRFPQGFTIGANVVLTIEPCTLILVGDAQTLTVGDAGTLLAAGTEGRPITFRSANPAASRGAWAGIYFNAAARVQSKLHYVNVEHAGGPTGYAPGGAVFTWSEFVLDANHLTVREAKLTGIALTGASRFSETSTAITVTNSGVADEYTSAVFFGEANSVGSLPEGAYTGNVNDEIAVDAAHVRSTQTWHNRGVRYHLQHGIEVHAVNGAVLTVEPGTRLAFASETGLWVGWGGEDGGLTLDGASEATRIVLTSARPSPEAGDWHGLIFGDKLMRSQTKLDFVTLEYAGRNSGYGPAHNCGDALPTALFLSTETDPGPIVSHTKFASLPAESFAILRGFQSATPTDYTAANLGNDFTAVGSRCKQNVVEPPTGCPDPVPACR